MSFITKITSNPTIKGITYMLGSNTICNVLQFSQIFILIKFYTQEEFGLWSSITSIAAILITGDFGITNVLRNILSRERMNGKDGNEEARKYYLSAFIFFLLFSVIAIVVLLILSPFIPYENLFESDNMYLKLQGRYIFMAVMFIYLLSFPFGMGLPMCFSYGESKTIALMNTIRSVVSFILVLILALLSIPILYLAIGYFSINFVFTVLGTIVFLRKRKWNIFEFSDLNLIRRIKEMLGTGIKFLGIQLSSSFVQNALIVYSGSMVGLTTAANVSIINKIFTFFTGIYQGAFNPIWSKLTEFFHKGDFKKCCSIIKKSVSITVGIYLIVITAVVITGQWVIDTFIGGNYYCEPILVIFIGLITLLRMVFDNISLMLNAISKLNFLLLIYLIFAVLIIFILPPVINNYGFNGMAIFLIFCWLIASILVGYYVNLILKK